MKRTRALAPALLTLAVTAAMSLFLAPQPAHAAKPFYLGKWKVITAEVAPWATSGPGPDAAASKSLVGTMITLGAKEIRGPARFPCRQPKYKVIEGSAEILFQGLFGEMHQKDSGVDPQKLAEQVGLQGSVFRTVITGCGFAVDFSFGSDPDLAAFALDDSVYRMKRQ